MSYNRRANALIKNLFFYSKKTAEFFLKMNFLIHKNLPMYAHFTRRLVPMRYSLITENKAEYF